LPQYEALFIVTPSFDESEMAEVSEAIKELMMGKSCSLIFGERKDWLTPFKDTETVITF
jgi:hypothetical protein